MVCLAKSSLLRLRDCPGGVLQEHGRSGPALASGDVRKSTGLSIGLKDAQEQFVITAHPQNAALAREGVKRAAAQAGFVRPALDDIEVAVGEATTNAILYGSPTATSRIVISCWVSQPDGAFHVEIRDQGQGFDPDKVRGGEDTDSLGGRGLRLMRALMDKVRLYYDGHGMSVRLTKLPSKPPAS